MATQLRIKRGTTDANAPIGLTAGEMAINLVDKKLYIGGTAGTNVVFLDSTSSVGLSTANTFTQLNTFSAGISASGATFTGLISGATATFSKDITVNSMTVGLGGGGISDNVAVGFDALGSNTEGSRNVAVGESALYNNTTGSYNVGVGRSALGSNTTGESNVGVGRNALTSNTTGGSNVGVGEGALSANTTGSNKTAIGYLAGGYRGTLTDGLSTGTGGIYIGYQARGSTANQTNEIVIGVDALGLGSNTAVIGATLQSSATIYGVLNLPSGLSASGATFTGNVSAQSTLYTDTILAIGNQINIANAASGRIAFGDYNGAGNSTYVFIRDGTSSLLISNPYGDIGIGDPNNKDSGHALSYNAVAGSLDGGNSSLTNFSSGSFGALLTASAGISAAGTTAATFNGTVDMNFNTLYEPTLRYYNEVLASPAITANVLTLDLSTAQMFTVSLNANITTFTISNTPVTANRSIGFTLIFTADGTARTVTWGAAVKWANNDPPALTSTNAKKDILSFVSPDGGTTWYGFIGGLNF